jgi:hypothetical protein
MTHHNQTNKLTTWFLNSTAPALWTIRLAPLQCQATRQHSATLLIECSVAGDKTKGAHAIEDIICYS